MLLSGRLVRRGRVIEPDLQPGPDEIIDLEGHERRKSVYLCNSGADQDGFAYATDARRDQLAAPCPDSATQGLEPQGVAGSGTAANSSSVGASMSGLWAVSLASEALTMSMAIERT